MNLTLSPKQSLFSRQTREMERNVRQTTRLIAKELKVKRIRWKQIKIYNNNEENRNSQQQLTLFQFSMNRKERKTLV